MQVGCRARLSAASHGSHQPRALLRSRHPPAAPAMTPPGFHYRADFLTPDEERGLVELVEKLPFREVRMHGVVARRTVIHYGYDYDYSGWKITPAEPPPPLLRFLIDRAAAEAQIPPESLEQFLISHYPAGASIGWHRDAPMFGSPVIGVSLL